MLISEAAARWGVDATECSARGSVVRHTGTDRTLRYGELAYGASRRPVPADVPLKPPSEWRLIGTSVSRVDTPEKVLGKPIFASDVRLPGMLFASYSACPAYGGHLKGFDGRKALGMPGVRQVIAVRDMGVAVLADSWWQAHKAMDAVSIEWDTDRARGLSSDAIRDDFVRALDAEDVAIGQRIGDVDAVLATAGSRMRAD